MAKRPTKNKTRGTRGSIAPEALAGMRAAAGAERAAHFAAGGDVAGWRGRSVTMDNRTKRAASRDACRGKVTAW